MLSVLLGSIVGAVLGRPSTRPWYAVGDHVSRPRHVPLGPGHEEAIERPGAGGVPGRDRREPLAARAGGRCSRSRSGSAPRSSSRSSPRPGGSAARSRRTSPTSRGCRRSSTASSGWRSSSGPSASEAWRWARPSGRAGLTLSLLVLPVIVIATQEALRTVPTSLRLAALALGATRWQMVRDHVLPSALPGILTGTILGLSQGHRRDGAAAHGRRGGLDPAARRAGPPTATPPCRSRSTITPRSRAPSSRPWPPEAS